MLKISNLYVTLEGKEIIRGISLTIKSGEIHALMGPNGSGKSTLAYTLMGHPGYKCQMSNVKCQIKLNGVSLIDRKPNERARMGLFLAFQNPLTVAGVPLSSMLRTAYSAVKGQSFPTRVPGRHGWLKDMQKPNSKSFMSVVEFNHLLKAKAKLLGLDVSFLRRGLNDSFSGGEKKKAEMLQALVLKPKFIIFDEIDTGLDIDALNTVALGIRRLCQEGAGILLITHYQRILHHVRPDYVHVLIEGRIVKSGGYQLAERIEREGYSSVKRQAQSVKK